MLRAPDPPLFPAKRTLAVVVTILCVIAASVAGARAWLAPTLRGGAEDGQSSGEKLEAEIVTLTPRGFEPVEITRPHGPFLLMVDNRSGSREMNLHVGREAGQRLREARVPRESLDWNSVLDLEPGRYTLTVESHPEWVCHITITRKQPGQ